MKCQSQIDAIRLRCGNIVIVFDTFGLGRQRTQLCISILVAKRVLPTSRLSQELGAKSYMMPRQTWSTMNGGTCTSCLCLVSLIMVRVLQRYVGAAIVSDVGRGKDSGASREVPKNAERHRKEPATDVQISIVPFPCYHHQGHLVRLLERLEQGLFARRFTYCVALHGVDCWLMAP